MHSQETSRQYILKVYSTLLREELYDSHFSPFSDHDHKNVFSLEEKHRLHMAKCKPSNICLLRTFLVKRQGTVLPRKTDLLNLRKNKNKKLKYNTKKLAPSYHKMLTAEKAW
jgi:uncharacterized membrane protein